MTFTLRTAVAALALATLIVGPHRGAASADDQQRGTLVLAGPAGADLTPALKWSNPQPSVLGDDGAYFDRFAGNAIALDGDLAVVGAEFDDVGGNVDQGSAYVLERSGNSWNVVDKLVASDGAPDDTFGYRLRMDGDTLIVGAAGAGAAYVFVRSGSIWTQQAKLVSPDGPGPAPSAFGWSVAVSADVAVVGNPSATTANGRTGAAYVFTRQSGTWTFQAKLVADDAAVDDFLGGDVALTGNAAIVGANSRDTAAGADQGAAYVFEQNAGVWTQVIRLTASDGTAGDQFGLRVAASSDSVVIGAYAAEVGTQTFQGAAYVYVRDAGIWTEQGKLTALDGNSADSFRRSVAIDGDTVVVGAFGVDVGANAAQGAAYAFTRTAGVWTQQARFDVIGTTSSLSYFGSAAAVDGDTVLIGGMHADVGDHDNQGVACAYQRTGTTWSAVSSVNSGRGSANQGFGGNVAYEGDTAVVGVGQAHVDGERRGVAYVYVRQGSVWNRQATLTASDGESIDQFGVSVAISGDTVLVGANLAAIGTTSFAGAAYVFVRNGTTWTQQAKLISSNPAQFGGFGASVALRGDTALVGARWEYVGAVERPGVAYVFARTGAAWSEQARLISIDGVNEDSFGWSVALLDDTALVGAPKHDLAPNVDQGAVYVFNRSGAVWAGGAKLVASDGVASDGFGAAMAADDDTVVIGASDPFSGVSSSVGSAYVFIRSQGNWVDQIKLTPPGGLPGDRFGSAVAFKDDVALIGAVGRDVAHADQGAAYRFVRAGATWGSPTTLTANDAAAGDGFGLDVAVDGETMLVGATGIDGPPPFGNPSEGAVYVFGPASFFADGFESP